MDVNNDFKFNPNVQEFVPPSQRPHDYNNSTGDLKPNGKPKKSKEARGPRKRRRGKKGGKNDDDTNAPSETSESIESSDYSTISTLCDFSRYSGSMRGGPVGGGGLAAFNQHILEPEHVGYLLFEESTGPETLGSDLSKELSASTEENLNTMWIHSFLNRADQVHQRNTFGLDAGQSFDDALQLESHGQWLQLNQEWALSKHRVTEESEFLAEENERRKWGAWAMAASEIERQRRINMLTEMDAMDEQERQRRRKWAINVIEREQNDRISDHFLATLSSTSWFNETISSFHEDYELVCPYYRLGCRVHCKRSTIAAHLKECAYAVEGLLSSPEDERRLKSLVREKAYDVVCPNRIIGCNFIGSRAEIEEHLVVCPYRGKTHDEEMEERDLLKQQIIMECEEERLRRAEVQQPPTRQMTVRGNKYDRQYSVHDRTPSAGATKPIQIPPLPLAIAIGSSAEPKTPDADRNTQAAVGALGALGGDVSQQGQGSLHDVLQTQIQVVLGGIHDEISELWEKQTVRKQTYLQPRVTRLLAALGARIAALWPFSKVEVFGSFATGIIGKSADLDLVVCFSDEYQELLCIRGAIPLLHILADHLARSAQDLLEIDNVLLHARIPVIKATYRQSHEDIVGGRPPIAPDDVDIAGAPMDLEPLQISIDISIDGPTHSGLATTEMVRTMLTHLPPLGPVSLLLKEYLKSKHLSESFTGGLPSYGVILLLSICCLMKAREKKQQQMQSQLTHEQLRADMLQQLQKAASINNAIAYGLKSPSPSVDLQSTSKDEGDLPSRRSTLSARGRLNSFTSDSDIFSRSGSEASPSRSDSVDLVRYLTSQSNPHIESPGSSVRDRVSPVVQEKKIVRPMQRSGSLGQSPIRQLAMSASLTSSPSHGVGKRMRNRSLSTSSQTSAQGSSPTVLQRKELQGRSNNGDNDTGIHTNVPGAALAMRSHSLSGATNYQLRRRQPRGQSVDGFGQYPLDKSRHKKENAGANAVKTHTGFHWYAVSAQREFGRRVAMKLLTGLVEDDPTKYSQPHGAPYGTPTSLAGAPLTRIHSVGLGGGSHGRHSARSASRMHSGMAIYKSSLDGFDNQPTRPPGGSSRQHAKGASPGSMPELSPSSGQTVRDSESAGTSSASPQSSGSPRKRWRDRDGNATKNLSLKPADASGTGGSTMHGSQSGGSASSRKSAGKSGMNTSFFPGPRSTPTQGVGSMSKFGHLVPDASRDSAGSRKGGRNGNDYDLSMPDSPEMQFTTSTELDVVIDPHTGLPRTVLRKSSASGNGNHSKDATFGKSEKLASGSDDFVSIVSMNNVSLKTSPGPCDSESAACNDAGPPSKTSTPIESPPLPPLSNRSTFNYGESPSPRKMHHQTHQTHQTPPQAQAEGHDDAVVLQSDKPIYGELIEEFLITYGEHMQCGRHGYSVRDGGFRFEVRGMEGFPSHPQANDPLLIEDPVDVMNNVGKSCYKAAAIQRAFHDARERFNTMVVRQRPLQSKSARLLNRTRTTSPSRLRSSSSNSAAPTHYTQGISAGSKSMDATERRRNRAATTGSIDVPQPEKLEVASDKELLEIDESRPASESNSGQPSPKPTSLTHSSVISIKSTFSESGKSVESMDTTDTVTTAFAGLAVISKSDETADAEASSHTQILGTDAQQAVKSPGRPTLSTRKSTPVSPDVVDGKMDPPILNKRRLGRRRHSVAAKIEEMKAKFESNSATSVWNTGTGDGKDSSTVNSSESSPRPVLSSATCNGDEPPQTTTAVAAKPLLEVLFGLTW
jgi:DNA polymerase sigma